ncbi:MAG: CHRD domain-containing protein [Thermoproteota archaeon]|nr:CHRD domain-containing protein [Thermoproteota archaeon]
MTDKTILKVTAIVAVLTFATIASVLGFAALTGTGTSVFAQKQGQFFDAKLIGKNEVPPKDTKATGIAEFTVTGANSMSYKVTVTNMEKVTAAHIHKGKVGENGPVIVSLFKTGSPSATTNGTLLQGNITSAKLEGPLAGKQLSDLINLLNNREAYVNVHTQANPNGEIRGQPTSM